MMMGADEPKSLQEAILYFSEPDNCLNYIVARRWPKGVVCPTCGSKQVSFIPTRRLWECKAKHAKRQFSAKVGTIMEDSAIGLDKWLCAMWMIGNCKNGVSSYEVSRDLRVTQKSAWFMLHRIRKAMQDDLTGGSLKGQVEIDETFIGGKARNMHKTKKRRVLASGEHAAGKTIVMGMLERKGNVRATVIPDRTKNTMRPIVLGNVAPGSEVITDEWAGAWDMDKDYVHKVINHLESYVQGNVHTNTLENFWSLLKRGLSGTYVSVEPFHLFRYVDEQAFRYNNRKDANGKVITDAERFNSIVKGIVGRRLTYEEVTGKLQAE